MVGSNGFAEDGATVRVKGLLNILCCPLVHHQDLPTLLVPTKNEPDKEEPQKEQELRDPVPIHSLLLCRGAKRFDDEALQIFFGVSDEPSELSKVRADTLGAPPLKGSGTAREATSCFLLGQQVRDSRSH
jgi:uncharacterized protein YbaR (Trm112 family)